jgi:hypothetical protein
MTPARGMRHWWREKGVPLMWLLVALLIVVYALNGLIAHADPEMSMGQLYAENRAADVCEALDATPTLIGLVIVLTAINKAGLEPDESAIAVKESVTYVCPHHIPLLREFGNYFKHHPTGALA